MLTVPFNNSADAVLRTLGRLLSEKELGKSIEKSGYVLGEKPSTPSDPLLAEAFQKMQDLVQVILEKRLACNHTWKLISYSEARLDGVGIHSGCHKVGIFDINFTCTTCLAAGVLKETSPFCTCCTQPLLLGYFNQNSCDPNCSQELKDAHREEYLRRRANPNGELFYTQFGVYSCTNETCQEKSNPKFYITGGD